jgi:hypothetical protein
MAGMMKTGNKPVAAPRARRRFNIVGHAAYPLAQWAAQQGYTRDQIVAAFAALGGQKVKPSTIRTAMSDVKNPLYSRPAAVGPDAAARFAGGVGAPPAGHKLDAVTPIARAKGAAPAAAPASKFHLPDEVPAEFREGNASRVFVNRYERDRDARTACIAEYGSACCVPGCGFDFRKVYGPEADGYIHVHHLRPLAEVGEEYEVDPINDLRPVCPNCHAMLHMGGKNRRIEEVSLLLARAKAV